MKFKHLLTALLFLSAGALFAESPEVRIRLFDKQIYTLNSPVKVQVIIRNSDDKPVKISLADNRVHNLKFVVKTPRNINILPSNYSIKQLTTAQPVYYKEITLSAHEEFSFVTDLTKFIDINSPLKYIVSARFCPDFHKPEKTIKSNEIEFHISALDAPKLEKFEETTSNKYLFRTIQDPANVIKYLVNARQNAASIPLVSESRLSPEEIEMKKMEYWNRFFLYLDIETLYLKNIKRKSLYLQLSEKERKIKLDEYKKKLMESDEDRDIILTPSNFKILKTVQANNQATVLTLETFTYPTFKEHKLYTYYLKKDGSSWVIYNYEVSPYNEGM